MCYFHVNIEMLFSLYQALRQKGGVLENRSQLVTECGMGPKVFLNSSGFIKLDSAAIQDITTYVEVLSGTRIHPETYEWAKKMAVDALEYDEVGYDHCHVLSYSV